MTDTPATTGPAALPEQSLKDLLSAIRAAGADSARSVRSPLVALAAHPGLRRPVPPVRLKSVPGTTPDRPLLVPGRLTGLVRPPAATSDPAGKSAGDPDRPDPAR